MLRSLLRPPPPNSTSAQRARWERDQILLGFVLTVPIVVLAAIYSIPVWLWVLLVVAQIVGIIEVGRLTRKIRLNEDSSKRS